MAEALLNEKRSWSGMWWLPEAPDSQIPGVLTYDPDEGILLRTIGGWSPDVRLEDGEATIVDSGAMRWPIIHGLAEAKPMTLVDSYASNSVSYGWDWDTPSQMEVSAATLLVDCHLPSVDAPLFEAGIAAIENLTAWVGGKTVVMDLEKGMRAGKVSWGPPDNPEVQVGTFTARLHHMVNASNHKRDRRATTTSVTERATIEFRSVELRPFQPFFDLLASIGDLMSLCTLSACAEISLTLYQPPRPEDYPEGHPGGRIPHDVQVYQRTLLSPKPDEEGAGYRDFLMTLVDLPFEKVIPRWIEIKDRFSAAQGMVLGLRYVTGGYLETQALTAVSAAESFHRALQLEPPIEATEFAALRKALLDAVPKGRRDWLAARIRNEPTLKERLRDLAERPGAFMQEFLPQPAVWAKAAADSRNEIAHEGGTTGRDYHLLHAVMKVTDAVVILNLLHELGLPEARMKRAIAEHRGLAWAAELAQEYFTEKPKNAA